MKYKVGQMGYVKFDFNERAINEKCTIIRTFKNNSQFPYRVEFPKPIEGVGINIVVAEEEFTPCHINKEKFYKIVQNTY